MATLSSIITPSNVLTASSVSSLTNKSFGDNPVFSAGTVNGIPYLNASKVLTTGSALQFNGNNLGLGVTPSANWQSARRALQISATAGGASIHSAANSQAVVGANNVFNGTNYLYLASDTASRHVS